MAFRKKNINEIIGTVLILSALLSTASAVDCFGKSFHCVNSTHFSICVDLGGGVSQSIDDFLIPCPPPTVCLGNNHFECEYPAVTTPSTTLSNVISETTQPWEEIEVTTNSPPKNTSTTKEYSEKYMNTVSITSLADDNLTTDTTIDVTTEVSSLSDVNSNVTEIVPISPIYEATTGFDGITQTASDNTVTGAAEITNAMPQMIPHIRIQNVTNETLIENVTLTFSYSEPTVTFKNNYTLAQNGSAGEIINITRTGNVTSENVIDDIVTPDTSLIDFSTDTERTLASITDESLVTSVNLVMTTAQTLVSTDELQNSANTNIQTSTVEPALIQNTLGTEEFQKPFFEESLTTESIQNSEKRQSTVLTPDVVHNVPAQLPITTIQSTVTTTTSMNVKDEVTDKTMITSEQPITTTYNVNFSTADHDIYTTEAPLTIDTYKKQDKQNTSESDQVPTKLTDDAIVHSGNEQQTKDINSLPTNIDVTTEQLIAFTTETHNLLVTEQLKINKDNSATVQGQKLIDTGIESPKSSQKSLITDIGAIPEKPNDLTTETQQQQETQIIINKNMTTTSNDAAVDGSVLPTEAQKPIGMGVEQSKDSIQSLATDNDKLTEIPSEFTTETQKLLVTEQPKLSKDNSVTERIQKSIDTGIESLKLSKKRLTTDPDITIENPNDLVTEQQQGTDHIIVNKNMTTTGNDTAADGSALSTEAQTPINKGVEQSKDSTQSLATDNAELTEIPSEFTTETQKLLVTEQPKMSKDNSATEQIQKSIDTGIESLKLSKKRLTTDPDITIENPNDLVTEQQQGTDQIIINKNITTTGNDTAADGSALPTEAQTTINKGVEQSKDSTQSLATDNDALNENPSGFTTETQKLLVTEQPKINKDNSATEQVQTLIDMGIESPKSSKKRLTTDPDIITENPSDLATETQQRQRTEQIIINKNITTSGNDAVTGVGILPTEAQKAIDKGVKQPKDSTQSLATDNDGLTLNRSELTTETPKHVRTTPLTTNKNNSATDNDVITEASVLASEVQTLIHKDVELRKISTKSLPTENVSAFTTVTQRSIYMNTERLTTIRSDLLTVTDITTEKAGIYSTDTQEPTKKITEEENSVFMDTEKPTTNRNYLAIDAITEEDFTTKAQKPSYTGTEQPVARTKSSVIDKVDENSTLSIEAQKPVLSPPQPITKATDIDVNVEKANISTIAAPKPIMSTEQPTTLKNDLTTDIKVINETAIGFSMGTSKPTIQIQEGIALGSDQNIATKPQKPENLTTDTIPFAVITTDAVTMESAGITEQEDSVLTDTDISNITKFQNNISSNIEAIETTVVRSINTTTATTTDTTTIKIAEEEIKEQRTAFTSSVKASDSDVVNELPAGDVQTIKNMINKRPNQNTFEVTAGTVDSLVPPTVKSVYIKKDDETSAAESTKNLSNGRQLSTNIDISDITNTVTTDKSFNIIYEINTSTYNTDITFDTPLPFGISEDRYLSPNIVKPTQDTQSVVEIVDKNQYTTESILNVTGTPFITKETKTPNNVNGSDIGISNNEVINEYMNNTDKVKSELHITDRVNFISAENIAHQLPATETTTTIDLGSISTFNLSPAIDSPDSNLQEDINDKSEKSNSAYSGHLFSPEVTSETTATVNFTPSLYPNNESSQKDKHLTSSNTITKANTNITDNFADGTSSFTTASNTILKEKDDVLNTLQTENGNVYKTLTSLNTQDISYVSLATEKSPSLHNNVADNQVPKLTTISENETHETVQFLTSTNDFKLIPVNNTNNVDDFISSTRDTENTGTAFTQKSTTVDGTDDSHLSKNNEIDQHVQVTTQTFGTEHPMKTNALNKNENTNNLVSNPLSNILLDKINQRVTLATESSTKNDGSVNSIGISSFGSYSIVDDSSTQLPHMQNTNDVTTQASIPIGHTNDNLPLKPLNSLSVTDDLYNTKYSATITKTENPSVIQPEKSLKETFVPKEDLFLNGGNVVTPATMPKADSTTEFSIKQNDKKTYERTESNFNTPSESSTPGSYPILSPYDFQDSTKTSSSIYSTESSFYGIKDNYDSFISKLGPVPTVSNPQLPATYGGYYTNPNKIEMSTEASKNNDEGNIILNKPVISEALPVPNYKIEMNTANINKPIPNASQGTKINETKTIKEPFNSATYNPRKYVTSTINNYQYVTEKSDTSNSPESVVNISSEASLSSQQTVNVFKTDAKSLPGQSNERNVAIPNKSQYNSSFYADTDNSGSKLTTVTQSTDFKSSNTLTNAANKQQSHTSQSNLMMAPNQVTEKVGLATNTTKEEVNSEANENKLPNNSSIGPSTITVTPLKNVPQDINKNGSSLSRNSTYTTKSQGNLESQQETTTISRKQNSGQGIPITIKQEKRYPVLTTSQAPIIKIKPRLVAPVVTTENPSKQITKTDPVTYSCIGGIRGRYSDKDDCRKFYICIGNDQPIVGNCPVNTVFSDISTLCTNNLSHCIRDNEFKCPSAGRFSDAIKDNVYYICVSHKSHLYRFKLQCQKGFTLNKATIRCVQNRELEPNQSVSISLSENSNDGSISSKTSSGSGSSSSSSKSSSSGSSSMSTNSDSSSSSGGSSSGDSSNNSNSNNDNSSSSSDSSTSQSKEKKESKEKPEGKDGDEEDEVFECEKEGKFPVRNDCRRYYLCKKKGKSEYRRKIKKCESGEVFHKDKKNSKNSSENSNSESEDDRRPSKRRQRKEKKEEPEGKEDEDDDQEVFECEREGKFPVPGDCRRYYLCKKNRKSEYRRKIKKCDSDEVFHKSKKKCVDADSYEC